MGDMAIAALSVDMHQAQTAQDLGVAVMKMAMEDTTDAVEALTEMAKVDPGLGANVDVLA